MSLKRIQGMKKSPGGPFDKKTEDKNLMLLSLKSDTHARGHHLFE